MPGGRKPGMLGKAASPKLGGGPRGVGIIAAMLIAAAAGRGLWLYRGAVAREIADIKSRS